MERIGDPNNMDDFSARAYLAKSNEDEFHRFAKEYEHFIIKQASKASGRIITMRDDEWSVALVAFHQAVATYDEGRSNFYSYATLVIKNRIKDYYRKQEKFANEIDTSFELLEGQLDEEDPGAYEVEVVKTIAREVTSDSARTLGEELDAIDQVLKKYGFAMFDVAGGSPKYKGTRRGADSAVTAVLSQPKLLEALRKKKKLPYVELLKEKYVTKKILERYRMYIIATIEILDGDFPMLAEYASVSLG